MIGTYAAIADGPVDVVTGDRDLFQVVDDNRGVVLHRPWAGEDANRRCGVHRGEVRVTLSSTPTWRPLRGDPSDGLPGARDR